VDWNAPNDRAYYGLTTFTWPTSGPTMTRLRLPEGSRILRATWRSAPASDDKPAPAQAATTERAEDGLWLVRCGAQASPPSLEVPFAGTRESPLVGACALQSIEPADTTPEETAWTIRLPPGRRAETSGAESRMVDGRQVISLTLSSSDNQTARLTVNAVGHN